MSDFFERRDDAIDAQTAAGCPLQLCPVKWRTEQKANAYVRRMAASGDRDAARLADLLDHVGITPDFEPSPCG
jgi:hypothetical protein